MLLKLLAISITWNDLNILVPNKHADLLQRFDGWNSTNIFSWADGAKPVYTYTVYLNQIFLWWGIDYGRAIYLVELFVLLLGTSNSLNLCNNHLVERIILHRRQQGMKASGRIADSWSRFDLNATSSWQDFQSLLPTLIKLRILIVVNFFTHFASSVLISRGYFQRIDKWIRPKLPAVIIVDCWGKAGNTYDSRYLLFSRK